MIFKTRLHLCFTSKKHNAAFLIFSTFPPFYKVEYSALATGGGGLGVWASRPHLAYEVIIQNYALDGAQGAGETPTPPAHTPSPHPTALCSKSTSLFLTDFILLLPHGHFNEDGKKQCLRQDLDASIYGKRPFFYPLAM
ncbi:MAG: hypothetical protein ACI3Y0_07105 [Prevotella sp.]